MKTNRIIGLFIVLVVLAGVLVACGGNDAPSQPAATSPQANQPAPTTPPGTPAEAPSPADANRSRPAAPITIGHTPSLTGAFALLGQAAENGVRLALEWEDREDDFNLIVEDSQGNAEVIVTLLDLLRHRDDARIIIGATLGGEGLASANWLMDNQDVLFMPSYSAPQDLTMRNWSNSMVRAGFTGNQTMFNFGAYVAQELGHTNLVIVGADYAFPWSQAAGFTRGFLENGGENIERVWYPMGNLDFSSIMINLIELSRDNDAVLIVDGGASVLAFLSAWEAFGLDTFYDDLFGGTNITFPFVLEQLPPSFEGLLTATHYWYANPSPINQEFTRRYIERFGILPDPVAVQTFDTMRAIIRALESLDWDYQNTEALIRAVTALTIDDSPRGSFSFDDWHMAVQDVFITETYLGANGVMTTRLVTVFENVSQFGPYVGFETEYMSMPVDARDYPPGNRAEYLADLAQHFGQEWVDALIARGGW